MPKLKQSIRDIFDLQLPNLSSAILWTLGIVIMSSLTVKDLCPTVVNYYDDGENAEVRIKVRRPDEDLVIPDLHFCIPLPNDKNVIEDFTRMLVTYLERGDACAQCDAMADYSFDVWNRVSPTNSSRTLREELLSGLDFPSAVSLLKRVLVDSLVDNIDFLTKFWDIEKKDDSFEKSDVTWDKPIVYSLIDHLRDVVLLEQSLLYRMSQPDHVVAPRVVVDRNAWPKARLDSIFSSLVAFVCSFAGVAYFTPIENYVLCRHLALNVSMILSEDGSPYACMRVPMNVTDKKVEFSLDMSYFTYYFTAMERVLIFTENPSYKGRASSNGFLPPTLYATERGDIIESRIKDLYLTYFVESTVIEAREMKSMPCYEQSSKGECELECWTERVESICDCRSYVYSKSSSSAAPHRGEGTELGGGTKETRFCADVYSTCNRTLSTHSSYDCTSECVDQCRSTMYQWEIADSNSGFGKALGKIIFMVRPLRKSYLEFTVKTKESSWDFISSIGGLFNFYLDLSGLSVIVFLVFVTHGFTRYQRMRREFDATPTCSAQSPNNDESESNAERLREMERTLDESIEEKKEIFMNSNSKIAGRMEVVEKSMDLVVEELNDAGKTLREMHTAMEGKPRPAAADKAKDK